MVERGGPLANGGHGVALESENGRQASWLLLRRISDGDDEALRDLYRAHHRLAFALAMRMLGREDAAEDVVQEAFLQVWRHAERFDPAKAGFATWLGRIVRNLCIDQLRRKSSRGGEALADVERWLAPVPAVDVAVLDRLLVREAFLRVPREESEVLELSYFQGLTHREIAPALAIPEGTVKSRMRLGLRKMRAYLEGDVVREEAGAMSARPPLSQSEAHELFGAYALGVLTPSEEEAVREAIARWPEGAAELQELMEASALLPLVPEDAARPSLALEGRLIAAARQGRSHGQTVARARQGMGWWRRHVPHTLAAGFAAAAIALGLLWAADEDPVAQGRWLELERTGSVAAAQEPGWVYVTDYQEVPVSLLFWHAPRPPAGEGYQLFRLLDDGSAVGDQVVRLDAEGNGVLQIERRPEEDLVGFAVALIGDEEALTTLPSLEAVVFVFAPR